MSLPNVGTARQGGAGVGLVTLLCESAISPDGTGLIFRAQPEGDVGIDGHLELIGASGAATGRILGVQVKAGDSYFTCGDEFGWTLYVGKATANYWRAYAVPVILALCDLNARTAYWARVDVGDFAATRDSYKVRVPRSQVLDATAVESLARIAAPTPSALKDHIALPPALADKKRHVRALLESAATAPAKAAAIDSALQLSALLRQAGFPYEAGREQRDAIRVLRKAGEPVRAATELVVLLGWVLGDLRDPNFARSLYASAELPASPEVEKYDEVQLPPLVDFQLRVLKAEADLFGGVIESASSTIALLESVTSASPSGVSRALVADSLRLQGLLALVLDDLGAAATAYTRLADHLQASHSTQAEHPEKIQWLRLRSALFAGLNGQMDASLEALGKLAVTEELSSDRNFVLGWLLAHAGRFEESLNVFERAGEGALAHGDIYSAFRAYSNAAWAAEKGKLWIVGVQHPAQTAARLEPIAAAKVLRESTYEALSRRIDGSLGRSHLREAILSANTARLMSWLDADPAANEGARRQVARTLRAAAEESGNAGYLLEASRETARTFRLRGDVPDVEMDRFGRFLLERLRGGFVDEVLDSIVQHARDSEEVVRALRFLARFGQSWVSRGRDERIATLAQRGLQIGRQVHQARDGVSAVEALVQALDPPLEGEFAATLRRAYSTHLTQANELQLPSALNAFAVLSASAAQANDEESAALLTALQSLEGRVRNKCPAHWVGAVGMLARSVSPGVARDALSIVAAHANAKLDQQAMSLMDWHVVERALAAGVKFPDTVADRYLADLARILEQLTAQVGSGALGGGLSADIDALTEWAAERSDSILRERTVSAAASFLANDGHLLTERMRWIPFIARLTRNTPSRLPEAIEVLTRAAEGLLQPASHFDAFLDPFSGFRVIGHTPDRVQGSALQWLASLLPGSDPTYRTEVLRTLRAGVASTSPAIREGVAIGASWAFKRMSMGQASEVDPSLKELRAVLAGLATDPVDGIARVALEALRLRD